jgi:shikimate 5-dehydrogenase
MSFTDTHIAYDLIYNPAETQFLKKAKQHGLKLKWFGYAYFSGRSLEDLE